MRQSIICVAVLLTACAINTEPIPEDQDAGAAFDADVARGPDTSLDDNWFEAAQYSGCDVDWTCTAGCDEDLDCLASTGPAQDAGGEGEGEGEGEDQGAWDAGPPGDAGVDEGPPDTPQDASTGDAQPDDRPVPADVPTVAMVLRAGADIHLEAGEDFWAIIADAHVAQAIGAVLTDGAVRLAVYDARSGALLARSTSRPVVVIGTEEANSADVAVLRIVSGEVGATFTLERRLAADASSAQ
ncbi:MAG: hypothetical protein KC620_12445 [Myxococcales bacterium]|nr:hypothetical protein [Myxococcales bacterium]